MSHANASATTCPAARDRRSWAGAILGFVSDWLNVALFLTLLLLIVDGAPQVLLDESRLRLEGVTTTAVVVARRQQSADGGTQSLLLNYNAPLDSGQPEHSFRKEFSVSPEFYNELTDGSTVFSLGRI